MSPGQHQFILLGDTGMCVNKLLRVVTESGYARSQTSDLLIRTVTPHNTFYNIYGAVIMTQVIARVHPKWVNSHNDLCHDDSTVNIVKGIVSDECRSLPVAADPQTRPTDLYDLHPPSPARKLILILPSYRGWRA